MRTRLIGVLALLLPVLCPAQEPKLPVFFLRYDGGLGMEEIQPEQVEEEQVETESQRHKLTLRVKEQWSEALTTDLYSAVFRKEYFRQGGSYSYVYLHPQVAWDLTDRLQWSAGFRTKWTWYDDHAEDLTSLLARSELAWRLGQGVKVIPYLQGVLDLYQDELKAQQTYSAGVGVESRLGEAWRLTGRCRGIGRFPLGVKSEVAGDYDLVFGVNLSWDPNP